MNVQTQILSAGSPLAEGFIEVGRNLSAEEPMTPGVSDRLTHALLSPANPFWQAGRAQAFWIEGEGRLIAFSHPEMRDRLGDTHVCFGWWASSRKPDVNHALFQALEAWARAQKATRLIGPINMKTAYDYRLRLNDFDAPPFWGEPTNPAYYVRHLETEGFEIIQNYFTDFIIGLDGVRHIASQKLPRAVATEKPWRIEAFSEDLFTRNRDRILQLANQLFVENSGFQKVDEFDFALLYGGAALSTACRKTSFLLFDQEDLPRGLCFSFAHPHDPKLLLIKTIGVDPAFRHAGKTFVDCLKFIFDHSQSYDRMAFCLMTENNLAHRLTSKYCDRRRTYGLFGKDLANT